MMKKFRKYIFAVVFSKRAPQFLIFHRKKNWKGWEFLKGGLKEKENEMECLKREVFEESGTRKFKIIKTNHLVKYRWTRKFVKDGLKFQGARGRLYLVQLFNKKVKIDKSEHDRFKWVDAKDALKNLTYLEQKNAFKYILKNYKLR